MSCDVGFRDLHNQIRRSALHDFHHVSSRSERAMGATFVADFRFVSVLFSEPFYTPFFRLRVSSVGGALFFMFFCFLFGSDVCFVFLFFVLSCVFRLSVFCFCFASCFLYVVVFMLYCFCSLWCNFSIVVFAFVFFCFFRCLCFCVSAFCVLSVSVSVCMFLFLALFLQLFFNVFALLFVFLGGLLLLVSYIYIQAKTKIMPGC